MQETKQHSEAAHSDAKEPAASPSGFDSAFYVQLFSRWRMVELYNFYFAGHVDLRDVTITSGVPVIALVNDSRTEWVTVVALCKVR